MIMKIYLYTSTQFDDSHSKKQTIVHKLLINKVYKMNTAQFLYCKLQKYTSTFTQKLKTIYI